MNEHEKKDEEIARALPEDGKLASKEERKVLSPEATQVLREFYEKAKAEGPKPPRSAQVWARIGTPNTP